MLAGLFPRDALLLAGIRAMKEREEGGESALHSALFRAIERLQNLRLPTSVSPSTASRPSSPPSSKSSLIGGLERAVVARARERAYVTAHLHNAAANCQCGHSFENKICTAVLGSAQAVAGCRCRGGRRENGDNGTAEEGERKRRADVIAVVVAVIT